MNEFILEEVSMKQRIITAVAAGLPIAVIIIIGNLPFVALVAALAVIGYSELLQMKKVSPFSFPGAVGFLLVLFVIAPNKWLEGSSFTLSVAELFLAAFLILLTYTVLSKNAFHFDLSAFIIFSTLYVGLGFHYLIEVRMLDRGLPLLFFILFLTWTTDSGAYFTGKAIGRRKLWPDISPKKTIEGAVGGIVSAMAVALIFQLVLPVYESLFVALAAALSIAVFGQLGDLVESAFKRHYGVKDSGNVLPGHGGILDRLDSLLFILPLLHLLQFI
jgi:phosphatidate cytidylyltransferase